MKISRLGSNVLIASAICASFSTTVTAQDKSRSIEEVIITAERKEASIQDTSISITAFTGDFMDDFGIRNQEDLQNFVPAMTIQPYDATVRGVGRNFRALGGDPGVATYQNGVYSEDLLTATAGTFWDVERIEVLRGPQGTLYGRNAVGGAINILYKQPTYESEWAFKSVLGNYNTEEYYGMASGALIDDVLAARLNFSMRDRDGVIEEIGPKGDDLDGLGTRNVALSLKWDIADNLSVDFRHNDMEIDRSFGGANGAGLVVTNEEGLGQRNTESLVPGYRFIDRGQTDGLANDYFVTGSQVYNFTDPATGEVREAQNNRAGVDYGDFDGFQNAAASLDGFNETSPESAARYNNCVFPGDIDGDDVCAATNGLNQELFDQRATQMTLSWDVSDDLQLKYIYGYNNLSYQRTTDDDNTGSQVHDRQFYVNHEADYTSHEFQAFYNFSDDLSVTTGIFFYDATIDQRGDFYSSVNEDRIFNAYQDNSALSQDLADATGIPVGTSASDLVGGGREMATLYTAKKSCTQSDNPADSCAVNYAVKNPNAGLIPNGQRNDNLYTSAWYGDNGTNRDLDVKHGPSTGASDLLYATQTNREAFAAYTQGVWDINETFTLTMGIRYAKDTVEAEENLWRYSETGGDGFVGLYGGVVGLNQVNGGLETDLAGDLLLDADGQPTPTPLAVNGGVPFALSVYRPYERTDEKVTGRINLDWNLDDDTLMYFSATSGYRSGGYNLVFFSETAAYDPEELIAYEIGYKSQFMDDTVQLNASAYFYDYDTIHTVVTEVSAIGGTTNSVQEAPGAEIMGLEAELLWLATDQLTLGGNFSYTPSEYTEDLFAKDTAGFDSPDSLYPGQDQTKNINGNQLLQVPEGKATAWASYRFPLDGGSNLEVFGVYTWIDDVFYSAFESETEMAEAYSRVDLRATWTSQEGNMSIGAFVNNVTDEVGILQVLRNDESENFRNSAGTTLPRMFGVEFSYAMGN
jgi:outer membrane receptor protein involved in Fe transport